MERSEVKILVVEDEAIMAMLLCRNLSLCGYQVCKPAATGQDAVSLAEKERPDVVLMDIRLAGQMDGIEAARQIVAQRDLPIIFVTGYLDTGIMERAKALHPAAFLIKPITPDDVMPIIDRILDIRQS